MMMKIVSVMIVGLMGMIRVNAKGEVHGVVLSTSDFDILCNVTGAISGVLDTVTNPDADVYQFVGADKEGKLNEKLEAVFFGQQWVEQAGGISLLPLGFTKNIPKRKEVCTSDSTPDGKPSASDSLAWTLLCLCVGTEKDGKGLCGLTSENNKKWPEDEEYENEVFEEVWGDHDKGGIIKKCVSHDTGNNFEKATKTLTVNIERLKTALNNTNNKIQGRATCDGSKACAKITENPTWLDKLKEFEELANQTLLEAEKEKAAKQAQAAQTQNFASTSISTTETEHNQQHPAPILEPPASKQKPEPEQSSAQDRAKTHKPEEKIAPEKTPNPQLKAEPEPEKAIETAPKQTDDNPQVPENETSGFFLTSPKWHLSAVLLL